MKADLICVFRYSAKARVVVPRVKHDGIAVLYVSVSSGGDGALFSTMLLSTLKKRSIEAAAMGEYRAAECALQEILTFKIIQILSNRNDAVENWSANWLTFKVPVSCRRLSICRRRCSVFTQWKRKPGCQLNQAPLDLRIVPFRWLF
jgi:hypothetical protein